MARLTWGAARKRKAETGVSKGILYPNGGTGVAWNGLISVNSSPEGAENTNLYSDNIMYGKLRSAEFFKGTIEAYTSPKEFAKCEGRYEVIPGLSIGQQKRETFNLCYRTEIYSANVGQAGYKIHLIYNLLVSPSDKNHETMGDSPDAITFSWDFTTSPVLAEGYRAFSEIVLDSTSIDWVNLQELEKIIYGEDGEDPIMPSPDFILNLAGMNKIARMLIDVLSLHGHWLWDDFNFLEDTIQSATERESYRHIYKSPDSEVAYIQPSISYELYYADKDTQEYLINVIDNKTPSGLIVDFEAAPLNLKKVLDDDTGEWMVSQDSNGYYHYPYILTV